METFEQGRLVWAIIADRNGYAKPRNRPAMVTATVTVSNPDDEIPVLVGTTDFYGAGHEDLIIIHDRHELHPILKIRRPTGIVCSWEHTLRYKEIGERGGIVRARQAIPIIEKMQELHRRREQNRD